MLFEQMIKILGKDARFIVKCPWLMLDVYWNLLSDILFISYTDVDVIYYCSEYLVWANQTLIMHYLIESHFVGVHMLYELPREK